MDDADGLEFYLERAAIIEFDGCKKRHDAEYSAAVLTYAYCERKGIGPPRVDLFPALGNVRGLSWSDEKGAPEYHWTPYS